MLPYCSRQPVSPWHRPWLLVALAIAFGSVANVAKHTPGTFLQWIGACDKEVFLDGLYYMLLGKTESGANFYRAASLDEFLYYDASCDGQVGGRWIVGQYEPKLNRTQNLTGMGCSGHHAYIEWPRLSSDTPPEREQWHEDCGRFGNSSGWKQRWVSIQEVVITSTTTTSFTTTRTTHTSSITTHTVTGTSVTGTSTQTRSTTTTTHSTTTSITKTEVCSCKPCCIDVDATSGCCDGADYARCCPYIPAGIGKVALNTTSVPMALANTTAKQALIAASLRRSPCRALLLMLLLAIK